MKFYSTNKKSPAVDFREATIKGQALTAGYIFRNMFLHSKSFINQLKNNVERRHCVQGDQTICRRNYS